MDSFEDWVKDSSLPCIVKHRDRLLELGVTWDTLSRPRAEVVQDLVDAGFPSAPGPGAPPPSALAARDVIHAACAALEHEQCKAATPLAVFWDVENVNLPRNSDTREVVGAIKERLRPFGTLTQFRAYCSVTHTFGANEQRRSDLQLSGVHILDTPHLNRKEVADKMIIVDAMEFAYEHPEGAAICIITGDTDFAYLLARLQRRPEQWRTILISKGLIRTMLHANATATLRWETDILRVSSAAAPVHDARTVTWVTQHAAPGADGTPLPPGTPLVAGTPAAAAMPAVAARVDSSLWGDDPDGTGGGSDGDDGADLQTLTDVEREDDDFAILRFVVRELSAKEGRPDPLKANVGNMLRQKNFVRFPDRAAVQAFLMKAIDPHAGILEELGAGATKRVRLRDASHGAAQVEPMEGDAVTAVVARATARAHSVAAERPWTFAFPYDADPNPTSSVTGSIPGSFVSNCAGFRLVHFKSHLAATRAAAAAPFLVTDQRVVFFDWRRAGNVSPQTPPPRLPEPTGAATAAVAEELLFIVEGSPDGNLSWASLCDILRRRGHASATAKEALSVLLDRGSVHHYRDGSTPPNPYVCVPSFASRLPTAAFAAVGGSHGVLQAEAARAPQALSADATAELLTKLRAQFDVLEAGDTLHMPANILRKSLSPDGAADPVSPEALHAAIAASNGEFVVGLGPGGRNKNIVMRSCNVHTVAGLVDRPPSNGAALRDLSDFVADQLRRSGKCDRAAMSEFVKREHFVSDAFERTALIRHVLQEHGAAAAQRFDTTGAYLVLRSSLAPTERTCAEGDGATDDEDNVEGAAAAA